MRALRPTPRPRRAVLPRMAAGALLLAAAACGSGPTASADPYPGISAALTIDPARLPAMVQVAWPAHYDATARNALDNQPAGEVPTDAIATLGRVLFFDRQLSTTRTVACASCHAQPIGFTDAARFSTGVAAPAVTSAHSMRLANVRFSRGVGFFWDRRAPSLEAQSTEPIQNPVEHGFGAAAGGLAAVQERMRGLAYYPELFRLAYGDDAITVPRIQRALATYLRTVVSVRSRWDDGFAQVFNPAAPNQNLLAPVPGLTAQELRGRDLFVLPVPQGGAGCAGCHVPPTFALAPNSLSNGLDAGETRLFKSPSLKNAAVSGPYMHDGRFQTLDEVVNHYVRGVRPGPALDPRLRGPGGAPLRLPLSRADEQALVAFLGTLTDTELLRDSRFTSPFRQ